MHARRRCFRWLSISSSLFTFKLGSRFGFEGTSFFFSHKRKREAEVDKTVLWLFSWKNKTNKNKNTHTWLTFCLPRKLLTNFEVAAAKSSRQLVSDNGCLHQQTNLLTVFGPCGFNWQLVRLTSAVSRNILQSKLNHGKEKLKFLLIFVLNYSLGKLQARLLAQQKWDSRRQTTFKVSVSSYVARISDMRGRRVIKKKNFARLLTFIFNIPSKMNQLSFARKAFALAQSLSEKKTIFLEDFFIEFSYTWDYNI